MSSQPSLTAIEEYLQSEMITLCSSSPDEKSVPSAVDEIARLFNFDAKFADVAAAFGPAKSSAPYTGQAPPSLRDSVEYRFRLARWPDFDFAVCASPDGWAWGQRFVRAGHSHPPPVTRISDLGRWSHTLPEISTALGKPMEFEGWSPWESATFQLPDGAARLCFVFELLQSVTAL